MPRITGLVPVLGPSPRFEAGNGLVLGWEVGVCCPEGCVRAVSRCSVTHLKFQCLVGTDFREVPSARPRTQRPPPPWS